jgi:hypothetical protein
VNVLETEWWTLAIPPEWWAESEAETVLVGDRDDVGVIEVSTLHKEEGDFSTSELVSIAAQDGEGWKKVTLGDFSGQVRAAVDEGDDGDDEEIWLREWYVFHGSMLLYITYSCELENQGMDDAAVDEILDTLMALSGQGADK